MVCKVQVTAALASEMVVPVANSFYASIPARYFQTPVEGGLRPATEAAKSLCAARCLAEVLQEK